MFGRATIRLGIGPHSSITMFLRQTHLMKTSDPLRPIAVVKEGQENKDFLSALAA